MRIKNVFMIVVLGLSLASCATIKPYEKEFLLSPIMDDESVNRLNVNLHTAAFGEYERVSVGGSASAAGTSCPTCGG